MRERLFQGQQNNRARMFIVAQSRAVLRSELRQLPSMPDERVQQRHIEGFSSVRRLRFFEQSKLRSQSDDRRGDFLHRRMFHAPHQRNVNARMLQYSAAELRLCAGKRLQVLQRYRQVQHWQLSQRPEIVSDLRRRVRRANKSTLC